MKAFERTVLDEHSKLNVAARIILKTVIVIGLGLVTAKFINGSL
jgi:hypothetical protein